MLGDGQTAGENIAGILRQFELCAGSVVKIDQYDGTYKVPELWIPQSVPLANLRVEKIFDFWECWEYFRVNPK